VGAPPAAGTCTAGSAEAPLTDCGCPRSVAGRKVFKWGLADSVTNLIRSHLKSRMRASMRGSEIEIEVEVEDVFVQ
jgi:hypothetical protein